MLAVQPGIARIGAEIFIVLQGGKIVADSRKPLLMGDLQPMLLNIYKNKLLLF